MAIEDEEVGAALAAFTTHQRTLGKALTAATRVEGRLGGTRKPRPFDVQKLMLREAMTANDIARGALDVQRYVVGSATIRYRFANVFQLT